MCVRVRVREKVALAKAVVAHVSTMCLFGGRKRQTGEKRDGEGARHVASPSGRLLILSSCCLRA